MSCCSCSPKAKGISFIGVGGLIIFLGAILVFLWGTIYAGILKSKLSLTPSSTSYKIWKQPSIPIYLEVYLYNITNSAEISKGDWSVKPNLTEHGPYVFLEKVYRVNETWNNTDHTISFKQIKTWVFQPNLTKGSLNDKITNLNVVTATIANMVRNKSGFIKLGVDLILREEGEKLLTTKTVRELLFDGYEDKILRLIANLSIPGLIPYSKFGWFYGRNNSADFDGTFEMWTGTDKLDKLGLLIKWNGKNRTGNFNTPCDSVKGTTGELWPPFGEIPNKTVDLFSSDMCSYISLDLDQDHEPSEKHGLEGIRYIGSKRAFDNGTYYPEQKCFANANDTENYIPRGLRNTSKCHFGAPAYLSFPHFYLADENLLKSVIGLKPDPKKHQLSIELEPKTGLPLQILARAQINIKTQKISGIRMFSNAQIRYWPMMWFTQRVELTEDLAGQVRSLIVLEHLGPYTGWGFVGFGVLFSAIGLAVLVNIWHTSESETTPLVSA